jgi:hypothetical protein
MSRFTGFEPAKIRIEVVNSPIVAPQNVAPRLYCFSASKLRKPASFRQRTEGRVFFCLIQFYFTAEAHSQQPVFHLRRRGLLSQNCEPVAATRGNQQRAAFGLAVAKPNDIRVRGSERTTLPKQKLCSALG